MDNSNSVLSEERTSAKNLSFGEVSSSLAHWTNCGDTVLPIVHRPFNHSYLKNKPVFGLTGSFGTVWVHILQVLGQDSILYHWPTVADTVDTKLKFPFRICRTLVVYTLSNVITEDSLEPCHLRLVLSTSPTKLFFV